MLHIKITTGKQFCIKIKWQEGKRYENIEYLHKGPRAHTSILDPPT